MAPKRALGKSKSSDGKSKGRIDFNLKSVNEPSFDNDEEIDSGDDDEDVSQDEVSSVEDSEDEETTEDKRKRIAREYLNSMKNTEGESEEESDDDDVINAHISQKLRKGRLESQGKYFRQCADAATSLESNDLVTSSYGGHDLSITSVALTADEAHVYSGSKDNSVLCWDVETGHKTIIKDKWMRSPPHAPVVKPGEHASKKAKRAKKTQSHHGEVLAVAVTGDNKYVVSGGRDNMIRIFDRRIGGTSAEIKTFAGHRDAITSLAFKTDTYTLFSGSMDRCIKHWDLHEMGYIETLFGHQDAVNALDCHIESRPVSGSSDHTVRLWRVNEESHLVYRGQKSIVDAVSVLNADSYLSGDENGKICLWKAAQKRPIGEIDGAHGTYSSHGNGKNLNEESPADDEENEGGATSSALRNNRWITSISAIKMSDVFASGSSDGMVKLWSVNTGNTSDNASREKYRPKVDMHNSDATTYLKPTSSSTVSSKHNLIQLVNEIPTPGFVNGLILTPNLLVAGCGREHKFGRWWCLPGNLNKLHITRLPKLDRDMSDEMEDSEDSDSEEEAAQEESDEEEEEEEEEDLE